MEETISQTNCPKLYLFENQKIEIMPSFVYEVSFYKHWKGGCCLLGNKFYQSNKLVKLKHSTQIKRVKDFLISKDIVLLGAPIEFIKENKLPLFIPKNGTRRSTKRSVR